MDPNPDHGEHSYRGNGKLAGRAALITGADSGIGRVVAIAFAREGADLLISYLCAHDDAKETARWVEEVGQRAVLVPGIMDLTAHYPSPILYHKEIGDAASNRTFPSLLPR
jgi:NAD(P)-dependent dehydrogenase (short-subunit alcohol dehydrogenase family)